MSSIKIEDINNKLLENAKGWESYAEINKIKVSWPDYHRGLVNFTGLNSFSLSSAGLIYKDSAENMILGYIKENNLKYQIVGYTGCAVLTKIPDEQSNN